MPTYEPWMKKRSRTLRTGAHLAACTLCACMPLAGCKGDDPDTRPSAASGSSDSGTGAANGAETNFFVTSDKSKTGNLDGLAGADARCQRLADAAGFAGTWVAYLSAEHSADDDSLPVHARDRI